MLSCLLALLILFFMFISLISFLGWVFKENSTAKKYRHMEHLAAQMKKDAPPSIPTQPQWKVVYKSGKKVITAIATGPSEAEAILSLVKEQGIPYDKILSSTKI